MPPREVWPLLFLCKNVAFSELPPKDLQQTTQNARTSVASISECQKMLAPQSPAFLSAKKCPHLSRQHF